jgi:hypothetical protein
MKLISRASHWNPNYFKGDNRLTKKVKELHGVIQCRNYGGPVDPAGYFDYVVFIFDAPFHAVQFMAWLAQWSREDMIELTVVDDAAKVEPNPRKLPKTLGEVLQE